MKNNLDYYSHYSNSDQHPKFKMLRVKYGWSGEGKFWALNNRIAQSENCMLDISKKYNKASIAIDIDFTIEEFDEFISYLEDECDLIKKTENGEITTDIIKSNFEKVMNDRETAKNRRKGDKSKKSPEKQNKTEEKDSNSANVGERRRTSANVTRQNKESKVKESKVKESKERDIIYLKERESPYPINDLSMKDHLTCVDQKAENTKHFNGLWEAYASDIKDSTLAIQKRGDRFDARKSFDDAVFRLGGVEPIFKAFMHYKTDVVFHKEKPEEHQFRLSLKKFLDRSDSFVTEKEIKLKEVSK